MTEPADREGMFTDAARPRTTIESLVDAEATIERVKALTDEWRIGPDRDRTHALGLCHQWHPDCLVLAIRAALEDQP